MSIDDALEKEAIIKVDSLNYRFFVILYEDLAKARRQTHTSHPTIKKYFKRLISDYEKIMRKRFKEPGIYDAYLEEYAKRATKIG